MAASNRVAEFPALLSYSCFDSAYLLPQWRPRSEPAKNLLLQHRSGQPKILRLNPPKDED